MDGSRWGAVGLVLAGVLILSTAAVADTDYGLSGSPAIETPTETVSYQGQTYTLDAVSRISSGGSVTITTSVPSGASYDLQLRGPDNQLISSESLTGDASQTLSFFGSGEAGTYAATIQDGGSTVAVYPIVIAGYDVSVDRPDSVDAGADATVSVTVSERDVDRHSTLETVQVVVGNDDVEAVVALSDDGDGQYTGTVSTTDIEPGTYNVYAVVRGDEEVRQRAELLGVSDTVSLTVESGASTATEEDAAGSGTPVATDAATATPPTATATPPPTATPDSPRTPTAAPSQTAAPTDGNDDGVVVIAPSTETTTLTGGDDAGSTTTGADGPGFTLLVGLVAVLVAGLLAARRE